MSRARVYIRPPTARDRKAFLEASARSRKLHKAWVHSPDDDESFLRYLLRVRKRDHAGFIVCRAQDDALVGVVNLNQIVRGFFHSAYLGYYVFAPNNGSGYMTEALQLVMRHAFKKMKMHRLEANIQPTNRASISLVKRCGFRLEGLSKRYLKISGKWRDHERWAITVEDWRGR